MIIILKDFVYRGQHHDYFSCELDNKKVVGNEDRIEEYVIDCLEAVHKFTKEES